MITCTTKHRVEAGHRLLKHEGECRNVHGHSYTFEVTVTGRELDEVGRVIDFSVIKQIIGGWLNDMWNHAFIYECGDPIAQWLEDNQMKSFCLASPPTAENLADHVYAIAELKLPEHVKVVSVVCHETLNCSAKRDGFQY